MKKFPLSFSLLIFCSNAFSQTPANCYTQANKELIKTELNSFTNIYKSVLADCNSSNPTSDKTACETDITHLKNNIEQLTALNTLIETLGCSYVISKDDKPCSEGKYCQSYKIEDKSTSNVESKSSEELKSAYDLERQKIRQQNRQEFFELVYKIIGQLLDGSNGEGLLSEIKKLISGETEAGDKYMILDENQSYVTTDGKRQGYKAQNKNGSTSFALDTDEDGSVDRLITYDKAGKVVGEKPMAKKRVSGIAATSKVGNKPFNFYSDCITTLPVKGFKGVCKDWKKKDHEFLYIIGASVIDCGESDWNWKSPSADIGLRVLAEHKAGKNLLYDMLYDTLKDGRLFGPFDETEEKKEPNKYEWLDYCSMRYNNFAIADLTEYRGDKIYIRGQEGDDKEKWQGPDDDVFEATVSIDAIRRGNIAVTGKCNIPGRCATLYFAIGTYNKNQGKFWANNLPSNIPSINGRVSNSIIEGILDAPTHPVRTLKDIGNAGKMAGKGVKWASEKAAFFMNEHVLKNIYDGANFIWDGPKKIIGVLDKKWVVIIYADGFCIFNEVRGYRTMDEIVNTSIGKKGDCDWWMWPQGSGNVCLDSKKNAQKMITKHGKIKDIKWIDHPTKKCGK